MSKPISRILSWAIIYLGWVLPPQLGATYFCAEQAHLLPYGVAPVRVYMAMQSPACR